MALRTRSSAGCQIDADRRLVDGRGDDVGGRFPGQLDDVFTEVCFRHVDSAVQKAGIQTNLLGNHGFPLDNALHIILTGYR